MKTWYEKLFWKKKQLNHLNIHLGENCITNTHRNLMNISTSHRGMMYSPLSTKCQKGNILFSCETMPSGSPPPLSADLSGSLDLCMNWVTGLERPTLTSSPFYLICFVPFQVCKKNGWIRHGLGSPTKTVRWRPKQQTVMLGAWATDKPASWVAVFTKVLDLLWLPIRV